MIYTYIQRVNPQSRNELKNKFDGKTILKDIAYRMCNFAEIRDFSFLLFVLLMCQTNLYIL
jgi:hypothetical protein